MKLKPLSEQSVVVFGASSGIGRATAVRLARRGARVTIAARNAKALETVAEEIRGFGGRALAMAAEATEFAQVRVVADAAVERFGRLDTWVHVAAVSIYARFEQLTPEEFRRVVDVNLNGQAYGAMAALPHLTRAGGGALIHISSGEARRAFPLQSAYAASKHGVKGLVDALRVELLEREVPISVTNIMPAGINTPFFDKARTKLGVKPKPPDPIYDPEVVAELVVYAAEHAVAELYAGGGAKALSVAATIAPRVTDYALRKVGFAAQKTSEARAEGAPDNLFGPVEGFNEARGTFGSRARRRSLYNWLEMHPGTRMAVAAGMVGIAATLAARRRRG